MDFPRQGLTACVLPGLKLRDADGDGPPVMEGHFAVFNQETEIDSFGGPFREVIAPGAFKKTFREQSDDIKVLFQHGRDPVVGDKPLGRILDLREDDVGAKYRVQLLDADYVNELVPALREGLLGASFAFDVTRQEVDESDDLPLRTIKEVRLYEFGPVTFPAYQAATAGVRSQKYTLVRSDRSDAGNATSDDGSQDAPAASVTRLDEYRERLRKLEQTDV